MKNAIALGLSVLTLVLPALYANPIGVTTVSNTEVQELRDLAQLSQLSYCGTEILDAGSFTCNICSGPAAVLTKYRPIISTNNATQGFVAVDVSKRTIFLSFQGATFTENWISAINFPRTKLNIAGSPSNAWVHQGFQDAYEKNNVKPQIIARVTELINQHPTFNLHAIGHSYGCAISSLAVTELVLSRRIPGSRILLTTFGCPRIGNFEFARLIDRDLRLSNVRRVTHSSDRISRLPPTPFGYRHAGKEMFIDVEGKRMLMCGDVRQGLDESPSCNNKYAVTALGINPHNSFFDHTQDTACAVRNPLRPVNVRYLRFEVLTSRP